MKKQILFSSLITMLLFGTASAQTLQDITADFATQPQVTIYTAKEIITLDPAKPKATAVAVLGSRILATGSLEELKQEAAGQPYLVDTRFENQVIVPGFIAQHDHPFLAAATLTSEILSIEDWDLPSGKIPAVKDKTDFMKRLTAAEKKISNPNELLVTWGYHESFFGPISKADLDRISSSRPIIVWHRSAHKFTLNSAALKKYGINPEFVAKFSSSQKEQSRLDEGNFWEQGAFAVAPKFAPQMVTPEKLQAGLVLTRDYMLSKGITLGCEPGGVLVKPLQDVINSVMGAPSAPFRFYFIPDGKSMADKYKNDEEMLAQTEKLSSWYGGMTFMLPKEVKFFADGAVYSQLMQVKEPYLDGHKGEWMTDLDVFERGIKAYWDAGYQIHIHVNGDAGMDRLLNTIEANMRRNPRYDHRTVIVHFAVSTKQQVDRAKKLGCIISGNPYYLVSLADNYSRNGLGPERADQMVRMGDVERAGISYSFHSDMPMAPADPLFLMGCAVNRTTFSGRVAGENQKVSREGALRAVTLEAAYSLQLDKEVGSISAGKLANFTILGGNPLTCDAKKISDIPVWGTIVEGKIHPSPNGKSITASHENKTSEYLASAQDQMANAFLIQVFRDSHEQKEKSGGE